MPATTEIHSGHTEKESSCEPEDRPVEKKKTSGFLCDERGYLDLVEHIIENGRRKGDRTGTGVVSVFGAQVRYSLRGAVYLFIVYSTCMPFFLKLPP